MILQRQFFEAIVRAVSLSFANEPNMTCLSEKMDYAFTNHFLPRSGKNRTKNLDEEQSLFPKYFKLSEKVFEMYAKEMEEVFHGIASRKAKIIPGLFETTID